MIQICIVSPRVYRDEVIFDQSCVCKKQRCSVSFLNFGYCPNVKCKFMKFNFTEQFKITSAVLSPSPFLPRL